MLRLASLLLAMLVLSPASSPAVADPVYASQVVACTRSAIYDAATNGSTKLVTGTATQQIYVCGFVLFGGGTATVKLTYGTGGTCGAGTASITPAFSLVAQSQVVDHRTFYAGLPPAPAGNDVCITTSAGVAVQGIVYYAQF
jgi:hypothetical protein